MTKKFSKQHSSGRGHRELAVKVKTARGRKISSTRWLQRQLNDPYVKRAKAEGYRGRAAYKILEIDDKFKLFWPGAQVVDLGCAPGGWSQVAITRVNALGQILNQPSGRIIGIDCQNMEKLEGIEFLKLDFRESHAVEAIRSSVDRLVDAVISDMAPAATGHKKTDHLRILDLCELAGMFAFEVLKPNGSFVAKVLAGGAEGNLQRLLKQKFRTVANFKPAASRSDSSEKYVVATGFRG
ncbi:MAG: RlmE family RNA methyltransferase [Aestuariivita sp.]|nr:RlmE family RNA methyltransferase [Aestuariivita sp.]MCY4348216.1 RlmE family RNA methyltransferase [Aestuariivita sp.]